MLFLVDAALLAMSSKGMFGLDSWVLWHRQYHYRKTPPSYNPRPPHHQVCLEHRLTLRRPVVFRKGCVPLKHHPRPHQPVSHISHNGLYGPSLQGHPLGSPDLAEGRPVHHNNHIVQEVQSAPDVNGRQVTHDYGWLKNYSLPHTMAEW